MRKYQRRTPSDWQSLIATQSESGLSSPAFCKEHDISYPSFISWKKKLTPAESVPMTPATFVEITPSEIDAPVVNNTTGQTLSTQASIEIDIGPGMQLRIYSH